MTSFWSSSNSSSPTHHVSAIQELPNSHNAGLHRIHYLKLGLKMHSGTSHLLLTSVSIYFARPCTIFNASRYKNGTQKVGCSFDPRFSKKPTSVSFSACV